jgi:hypothetical protein
MNLWHWLFHRRADVLDPNGETMRRIRAADEQDTFARDMDDARVVQPRTVADGPTSRYDRPVSR